MPVASCSTPSRLRDTSRTELDQFADALLTPAPLFPVAHADTTPEPMIQFNGISHFKAISK
jgi:hypothetical protein